ncbi:MAG: sialate O-acetylesterase [Reichenbachiella sp.]
MMKRIHILFTILFTLLGFSANSQELKLSRLFADHMVLQREVPTRFWGSAGENEIVTISIDGFDIQTRTNNLGKWECLFPAHDAGGPHKVVIKATTELEISDVYFGDVWIASGQSNMEWKVSGDIVNMEAEIADSEYPLIRFFEVPKKIAPRPVEEMISGEWKEANSENVKDFSAVAWFFAKKNHIEKNVPVGIIGTYWGGTPAEAWTSVDMVKGVSGYEKEVKDVLDPLKNWDKEIAENENLSKLKWDMIWDKKGSVSSGVQKIDFDDSNWNEIDLPNSEPFSEFVWVRKNIELKNTKDVKLSFGRLTNLATVYLNGTEILDRKWKKLEVLNISPEFLKKGKNVIAIRALNDWDNKVFLGKAENLWIKQGKKKISLEGKWKYSNEVEPEMPEVINYSWKTSFLFNGMINPIAGYSIKGAIWYQGESNVGAHQYYRDLFGTMIQDWRLRWKQGNFPFLFVQLANFMSRYEEPTDSDWAKLREAQSQSLDLPNTGMATIIDIGEAEDIHPRNKKDVGERLWFSAQKMAFGDEVVFSGPTYASHTIQGGKVSISFENIGAGLKIGGDTLTGFAIAGADKKYYWAKGSCVDNQIVISSEKVKVPMYIRYAWADNPACNLYNSEGLPAVPFRTD